MQDNGGAPRLLLSGAYRKRGAMPLSYRDHFGVSPPIAASRKKLSTQPAMATPAKNTICHRYNLTGSPGCSVVVSKKSLNSLFSSTIGSSRCRLAPKRHRTLRLWAYGE